MATIKRSAPPKARTNAPKPAAKPPEARKPAEAGKSADANKPDQAKKPTEARGTEQTPEAGKAKENGEATKPEKLDENGQPIKDSKETEEGKEPTDEFKESDELKEDPEKEEMREELQGLKDALAALYDKMGADDEKSEEKAESMGGCCGKPSGAKQAGDSDQNKDWNSILTAGIAAVKAQNLGQPNLTMLSGGAGSQGLGQQNAGQAGAQRGGGMAALANRSGGGQIAKGANGQGGDPRTKLASDYQKAKTANAQLRPEVENEVRNLLGMPPLNGQGLGQQQQGQGLSMASGF